MFENLLTWLSGLPPVAVYAVIGLLAAVENIFPPFPADASVALGAFLSHRGLTDAWTVFAVTFVANVGGAMAMYFLAARHAPALFRSKFARKFLPADGLAYVRRGYERFGLPGLFLGRMLPGFRVVVAPFAGLIHLGPIRAGIPIAIASAIWYGGIVFLVSSLGAKLETVLKLLDQVNLGFGIVALVLLVIIVLLGRRTLRRRRERLTPDE
jgi:membrane protein DedA with SNARE-associated domain